MIELHYFIQKYIGSMKSTRHNLIYTQISLDFQGQSPQDGLDNLGAGHT